MRLEGRKITFMTRRLGGGGAERMTATLASNFARRGLDVSILCIDRNDGAYAVDNCVSVHELRPSGNTTIGRIQRLWGIDRYMRRYNPDVVIALGGPVFYIQALNRRFGCDLILSERNWPPSCYSKAKFRQMERLYETATKVVFQTDEARGCFSESVRRNSAVIPNAIMPGLPERRLPVTNRIVSVGRLEPQKNYDLLLEAFARFKRVVTSPYTLEIYGTGSLESHLQQKAFELGISDDFMLHGFCVDVHDQISDARLFVTSSDFEGLQNSLMEAMAMGIPCVATDCEGGGARLITGNGTRGLLVSRGEVDSLSKAMLTVVTDTSVANRLSMEGARIKDICALESICDRWVDFITQNPTSGS